MFSESTQYTHQEEDNKLTRLYNNDKMETKKRNLILQFDKETILLKMFPKRITISQ